MLCRHYHRMASSDGWCLARSGRTDEDPTGAFTPVPTLGPEPDLGLDRLRFGAGADDRRARVLRTWGSAELMARAPPRGPTTDRRPHEWGAVLRAHAAHVALVHEIAEMRAAPLGQIGQRAPEVVVEPAELRRTQ